MSSKTALVTGSAKGMGRSIALHLAEKGYDIIVNARTITPDFRGEGAVDVMREIGDKGQKAWLCQADVGTREGREKLLQQVDEVGRLDLLVNNAGKEPPVSDMLDISEEDLKWILNNNFYGPFALTQQVAKRMISWKEEGTIEQARIVFLTSIQADRISRSIGYCLSKIAIRHAVQQFAVRLGEADIPVLEFTPGVFLTSMSHQHEENITRKLANGEWSVNRRWGDLDEIGRIVASVADGLFDYSTGSAIAVSGGMQIPRL